MKLIRVQVAELWRILVLSFAGWLAVLELVIFFRSSTFYKLHEFVFKPYKESISSYDVGLRAQQWDDKQIAKLLYESVRVHCLLYLEDLGNGFDAMKAEHIRKTWGCRCNELSVFDSREISLTEAYLWIYRNNHHKLDWLLSVSMGTYVIVENLRHMLAPYSPSQAIYFSAQHGFYSYAHVGKGATTDHIFSRGALEHLTAENCLHDGSSLRACLARMDRGPSDKLLPFHVQEEVLPFHLRTKFWLWPCTYRSVYENQSRESCFGRGILYPYVNSNQLHVLDFLLYHLRPYGYVNPLPELRSVHFPNHIEAKAINDTLARRLSQSVRVLCLVLTWPTNHLSGAKTISETWGRHCNRVVFYSSSPHVGSPGVGVDIVGLNISDSYDFLWGKTKAAFRHAYRHYRHEADWFFKADDDTYAIIENMRYMLSSYSPDTPIHFGCNFQLGKVTYMSGGAGYVLSRKALQMFITRGIGKSMCRAEGEGTEDYQMGICMNTLNVTDGDSRDHYNRHRFFPIGLEYFLIPGRADFIDWLKKFQIHTFQKGINCCSTYSITMHKVSPYEMHFLEAILYSARPYGIIMGHPRTKCGNRSAVVVRRGQQ
ncbi:GL15448 [Drosophila persimilis]|uniref:N-acetylgalactosaminide beta-1,3-galactosyltransferase n=1 Tax=Drosophila persimilis TaxID=7234 RepID=B4HBX6_DROPE|nr:uncharacterized protein LOC6603375 [Drosophila persimilis]EDW39987.1 GL15448 [Drosophila persimilis]